MDAAAVVLITGANRGLGRALALQLAAADGPQLALLGRDRPGLEAVAADVSAKGGTAAAFLADVTDRHALDSAVADIEDRLGPVDVLVNNAGVPGPVGELWTVEEAEWWKTIEVNLRGTYNASAAVLPSMTARRSGRIVNVVSHAGVYRWPYYTSYVAAKAACVKLTESLALETRQYGIAVLAVHPGLVRGGFTDAIEGAPPPEPGTIAEKSWLWFERQIAEGHTVSLERAAAFLAEASSGRADALSGRYFTVEDDLDDLVAHAQEIRRQDLQVLKLDRFGD